MKKAINPQTNDAKDYLRSFYRGNRLIFAAAVALMACLTVTNLFFSWVLGEVVNIAVAGDLGRLLRLAVMAAAVLAGSLLSDLAMYRAKARFIHRALRQYKDLAFSRLAQKGIAAFTRETTGKYLSVLTNDVNSIEENYLNRTIQLVYYAALFVGALGMMLWYSWGLTLAAIGLSLLTLSVGTLLGGGLARREKEVSDQNELFVSHVKDFLSGFSVIKSFRAEARFEARFQRMNAETEAVKLRRRRWDDALFALSSFFGSATQVGIMVIGCALAITGHIAVGTVLIFTNLCNFITAPIQTVPRFWASRKAAKALVDKLAQAMEENAQSAGKAVEPVLRDAISLQNVTYGYAPGQSVLRDVSLTLEAGKKYALVGPSGSGKSTLLRLLMGASGDYAGSITLDGAELRDIAPESLYKLECLMGQEVFLFNDTLQNNITLFSHFDPQIVAGAARRAGLGPLLAEKGDEYPCGENGSGLSGGERQRVAIARCLLRQTPVMLLDETTAALDNQTAHQVIRDLLDLPELTEVVVTHRLERDLLERYDRIIVLQDGQVREQGPFQDLMRQKGLLYSLYTLAN